MIKNKPSLLVICGPTASGKSSWALELAQKLSSSGQKVEIVSADSRAVYQEMNIGTAKPSPAERKTVPHHLIDIIKPDQEFNVALFKKKAQLALKKIQAQGNIAFLVGGTGLYIKAIVDNLDIPPIKPDPQLRKKIATTIEQKGIDYAWQQLLKLDPQAKEIIAPNNPRRIIRALEVCQKSKKPFSQLREKKEPDFRIKQVSPKIERKNLDQRINQRVDKMFAQGLIEEVRQLKEKYPLTSPGLNTIAYQEIILYLQGKITQEEARELIKKNTRHYARRQITWFKKDKSISWVPNLSQAKEIAQKFLFK